VVSATAGALVSTVKNLAVALADGIGESIEVGVPTDDNNP